MIVETVLQRKGSAVLVTRPTDSISDVARQLRENNVGALVVSDDGRAVEGIISERDLIHGLAVIGVDLLDRSVAELMTRTVVTCSRDDEIASIMQLMTERRIRHVPVVEDGALCGMISIGDVVLSRLTEMERETEALKDYIVRG